MNQDITKERAAKNLDKNVKIENTIDTTEIKRRKLKKRIKNKEKEKENNLLRNEIIKLKDRLMKITNENGTLEKQIDFFKNIDRVQIPKKSDVTVKETEKG